MVVRISHKEEITYSDQTQQVRIFRLLSRPSMGREERIILYKLQTKNCQNDLNNLREIIRYCNQNLLQNSTCKTPTKTVMEPWETSPAPEMPARQHVISGERSQGHHLSQASNRGHSKGHGQGSCALPGLSQ